MLRVRWTKQALANLNAEARYIAREDPRAAMATVRRVRESVEHLAKHPALGRPGRVAGTRELVVVGTPYILPYRVREGSVEILRVFHGARRWPEDM